MAEQLRSFLPERRQNLLQQIINPRPSKKSEPNIFQRFTDIISPQPKKEEPKDPFSEILNQMVDVIDPNAREAEEESSDPITSIINRMVDVIDPKPKDEPKDPISNIYESFTGILQPQSKTSTGHGTTIGDIIRSIGDVITPQKREVKLETPLKVNTGQVGRINIVNSFLRSPTQIMDKISALRQKYFMDGLRGKRSDTQFSNNLTLPLSNHLKVRTLKVQNLIYSGDLIQGKLLI